jgi:ectoine hydroxylase-related dioxygenase (phytanoyl-CoA dioxygenase family)
MAQDLSLRHQPVSDLFPRLQPAAQLAHYEEHGFVGGIRMFDDAQLAALRAELAAMTAPECPGRELFYEYNSNESADPSRVLFHALGAWRAAPGFHDLLWNPRFLVPAAQLLGGPVRFWHDQLFVKPARHGGVVAWHQDYSYWTRTTPLAHLTCWIGLDHATKDNGCVCYVPGSHRWELLPITGLAGGMDAVRAVLTPERQRAFDDQRRMELKAGEAVFHHPLTMHGSYENRTDGPRRATVVNVFRDGVASASDDPLLAGVPPTPKGEKMDGQFFPLLAARP